MVWINTTRGNFRIMFHKYERNETSFLSKSCDQWIDSQHWKMSFSLNREHSNTIRTKGSFWVNHLMKSSLAMHISPQLYTTGLSRQFMKRYGGEQAIIKSNSSLVQLYESQFLYDELVDKFAINPGSQYLWNAGLYLLSPCIFAFNKHC